MNQEYVRQRLARTRTANDYYSVRAEFLQFDATTLFQKLFPVAVVFEGDGADQIAGQLLVELEPTCPTSCREALLAVALGEWQLSDKLIPFYLVCQFGKFQLLETAEQLLAEVGLSGSQKTAITGVTYWAKLPTVKLLEPFISWGR